MSRSDSTASSGITPNTAFLLAALYDGRPIIPLEVVRKDYFSHLTLDQFTRKLASAEIPLPVIRTEASQKSPKGVHLGDLAAYLDERRVEAKRVLNKMLGTP